jgi:hypothetical protein
VAVDSAAPQTTIAATKIAVATENLPR